MYSSLMIIINTGVMCGIMVGKELTKSKLWKEEYSHNISMDVSMKFKTLDGRVINCLLKLFDVSNMSNFQVCQPTCMVQMTIFIPKILMFFQL